MQFSEENSTVGKWHQKKPKLTQLQRSEVQAAVPWKLLLFPSENQNLWSMTDRGVLSPSAF